MEITVVGNTSHAAGTLRIALTRQDKGKIYRIEAFACDLGPVAQKPLSELVQMIAQQGSWVDHLYSMSQSVALEFKTEGNMTFCYAWKRFYAADGDSLRQLVDKFINEPHVGQGVNVYQIDRLALTLEPTYSLIR